MAPVVHSAWLHLTELGLLFTVYSLLTHLLKVLVFIVTRGMLD
jgi:hypothetical protein